ncbi:MAG: hypothetical protein K6E29_08525 [Cyanobacteria bacterium RUI128]|nr:hypothetical protein [Cyanobacteria bacterium RUI128]
MDLTINNSTNFKANYHMYFFTPEGKRIVSDENMKKCLHYVEAHLNNAKRVQGKRNMDLVDTFRFGQLGKDGQRIGGDTDYYYNNKIRTVIDNTVGKIQGFMNIVSGGDVDVIAKKFGERIGTAKSESLRRTGSTKSFEASHAVSRYVDSAPAYAESRAVFRNGKRVAFGVIFEPVYNKKGEVKKFEYKRAGFFDEAKVK